MEPTTVEAVCNLLSKSRLLSAAEVRSLHQRWRTEAGRSAEDLGAFTAWLVVNQSWR